MNTPEDDVPPPGSFGRMVEGHEVPPLGSYGSHLQEKALDKDPSHIGTAVGSAAGCLALAYILVTVALVKYLFDKGFGLNEIVLYGVFTVGFFVVIVVYLFKGRLKGSASSEGASIEMDGS